MRNDICRRKNGSKLIHQRPEGVAVPLPGPASSRISQSIQSRRQARRRPRDLSSRDATNIGLSGLRWPGAVIRYQRVDDDDDDGDDSAIPAALRFAVVRQLLSCFVKHRATISFFDLIYYSVGESKQVTSEGPRNTREICQFITMSVKTIGRYLPSAFWQY